MSKPIFITIIVASSLLVAGLVLGIIGLAVNGFDWKKLSTIPITTNTHTITQDFDKISIDTDTTDVVILLSQDDECKVVCEEYQKAPHGVKVDDGVLSIRLAQERHWYDFIGISIGQTQITVYLPKTTYASLSIDTDTGDIDLSKDVTFTDASLSTDTGDILCDGGVTGHLTAETDTGDITLSGMVLDTIKADTDTGKIKLNDIQCANIELESDTGNLVLSNVAISGNMTAQADTGSISLTRVVAQGEMRIKTSTGGVKFDHADATSIYVHTSTGSVKGSLLSEKIFFATSSTGSVHVPDSMTGGRCEIKCSTGSINIEIVEP